MRFKDELQREIYYTSQIDLSYLGLRKIMEENETLNSPMVAIVDKATGYDKVKFKEDADNAIKLVKRIIRCKEKLGYGTVNDKYFLNMILSVKEKYETQL
jgi:hypothetical protein